ncbi:hypothetical protein RvY_19331 [Ramazzottius varieornatus]|uniref:Uncharacterized protein n=1 Tax=Ramazzottius varieornatus TaxID=947166 RepID=A0A1D1WAY4_RAMVA|nr:hypothetical protein RvY_19331 [Ramazzottius varieornatus]
MAEHQWASWANEKPLEQPRLQYFNNKQQVATGHSDQHKSKGKKWPLCKCVTTFPVGLSLTTLRFPQTIHCGHFLSTPYSTL